MLDVQQIGRKTRVNLNVEKEIDAQREQCTCINHKSAFIAPLEVCWQQDLGRRSKEKIVSETDINAFISW